MRSVASKTLVNHATANPLLYIPGVYFWNGKLYHGSTNEEVIQKLKTEYVATCLRYGLFVCCGCTYLRPVTTPPDELCVCRMWAVWIPSNVVMFALVPTPLQVPFISVVNFGWNTMLSLMYHRDKEEHDNNKPQKK